MDLNCKIYELKGLIKSLSAITERDEDFHHPIIDTLQETMNEVITIIEGGLINGANSRG